MSNDLITLSILVKELENKLIMGKVIKVNQPENDEIRLNIRNNGENFILVISSNPNNPTVNLTNSKKQNPIACPNFCMLLRKYLTNSILKNISLQNSDRIIRFEFESKDELKYTKYYYIYVELINRYSNIIFTNENNIILNVLRQIPLDNNQKRPLFSGIKYEYLPQNSKPCIFNTELLKVFLQNYSNNEVINDICKNFSGITKDNLCKLFDYLNIDNNNLNENNINKLTTQILEFNSNKILDKLYFYSDDKNYNFSFINNKGNNFTTLNEAIDNTLSKLDSFQRLKDKTKNYHNLLNKYIVKTEKKIKINEEKLEECKNRDRYKLFGELLTSNIYLLKKGEKQIVLQNYYDNYNDIVIKLDEKLSPNENIQKYYKKYSKLKKAEGITLEQLEINKTALLYAKSILVELNNLQPNDDISDILEEMSYLGIIKKSSNKVRKEKPEYYVYNINGYKVIAGKNNIQNDYLTFKLANSMDIWCHTKNSHGSHIIIFRKNGIIEENIIDIALEIAAFYSENNSSKVEVDYTERKNVARIDAKHKGLVNYKNYKTKLVEKKQHLEFLQN